MNKLNQYVLGGKDGKQAIPVKDSTAWAARFERKNRFVAGTECRQSNRLAWLLGLRPDYRVSTVFLGIDHNWGEGPPLLFETMVFRDWPKWKSWLANPRQSVITHHKNPPWWMRPLMRQSTLGAATLWLPLFQDWSEWAELDCERCSTWDEAEKQHEAVVKRWSVKC